MTKEQIKHMVDRFLGWKLPSNFSPDAGISFKATFNEHTAHPMKHEPTGTNLFDAGQADAMVRYMADGLPSFDDFRWLIEAPGPKYLAVQRLTSSAGFEWTADHNSALAFRDDKSWKREFQEALESHNKQIERLIEGLREERDARKIEDATIKTTLSSMGDTFSIFRSAWVVIALLATAVLSGFFGWRRGLPEQYPLWPHEIQMPADSAP